MSSSRATSRYAFCRVVRCVGHQVVAQQRLVAGRGDLGQQRGVAEAGVRLRLHRQVAVQRVAVLVGQGRHVVQGVLVVHHHVRVHAVHARREGAALLVRVRVEVEPAVARDRAPRRAPCRTRRRAARGASRIVCRASAKGMSALDARRRAGCRGRRGGPRAGRAPSCAARRSGAAAAGWRSRWRSGCRRPPWRRRPCRGRRPARCRSRGRGRRPRRARTGRRAWRRARAGTGAACRGRRSRRPRAPRGRATAGSGCSWRG